MRSWGVAADRSVLLPHPSAAGFKTQPVELKLFASPLCHLDSRPHISARTFGLPKIRTRSGDHHTRSLKVRALGNSGDGQIPISPLQFETPTGQLLSQIMQTHPHLLPEAIDQQLERLQSDLGPEKAKTRVSSSDLSLYRRIAELNEKVRRKTLEEIIYCSVVQKFIEKEITMIPTISTSPDATYQVNSWPNQEHKLESIHSVDALKMIHDHLRLMLGEKAARRLDSVVQINKQKLGKLYAGSIMYGYVAKRADERFQLEKSMNTLPKRTKGQRASDELKPNPLWDWESMGQISSDDDDFNDDDCTLRSYLMGLDPKTFLRYATIRSKESLSVIERQTQALFGRPDIRVTEEGSLETGTDEVLGVTISSVTMLLLEAVGFGTFLWDAEGYVDSMCHFVPS